MRSLGPLAASGLSNLPLTRRRYPMRRLVRRRVYREHRRVLVGNPTTRNPLLIPNTAAIVGFVGLCEKV